MRLPSAESGLNLEGRLHLPDAGVPVPGLVVCHPYPPGGGSLLVKVVRAICREAPARGWAALRFNFRGVGRSDGTFDDGRGELDDVAGAWEWLGQRPEVDPSRRVLVGYSFGAAMALGFAQRLAAPPPLVLVAPPLGWSLDFTRQGDPPWLMVAGDQDEYCPAEQLRTLGASLGEGVTTEILGGVDHFFIGSEPCLTARVMEFVAGALEATAGGQKR